MALPGRPGAQRPLVLIGFALHLFAPILFFTDRTQNPYLIQIGLIHAGVYLALLVAAYGIFRARQWEWAGTPLDGPVLLLGVVSLLSWGWAVARGGALSASLYHEGSRGVVFLWVNGLGVFFLSTQTAFEWRNRKGPEVMMAVGLAAAAYGLVQYAGIDPLWPHPVNPFTGRPISTFGNPNFLSTALVLLIPLGLWKMMVSERRVAAWTGGGVALVFSVALLCTMTRSSYVGAGVAFLIFAFGAWDLVRSRPRRLAAWIVLLVFALIFWPGGRLASEAPTPMERVVELWNGVVGQKIYASWHQRRLIWSCAIDMWKSRPWTGTGWGTFEVFFPFFQGRYLSDPLFRPFRTHANNAHQILLEFGSQTGLLGVGILFWLGVAAFRLQRARRAWRAEPRWFSAALWAGLWGALADNFFGNVSLFFAVPCFLFCWMAGQWAVGETPVIRRGRLNSVGVAGLSLGLIAAAVGLGREWRLWRAAEGHLRALRLLQAGATARAEESLSESRRWYVWDVHSAYERGNLYARRARWAAGNGLSVEKEENAERAIAAYGEALSANAGYDEIYFNRAGFRADRGDVPGAVRDYRWALLINPLNPDAYRGLAALWERDEPPGGGLRALYESAVFYFPSRSDFWFGLSRARERAGDVEGARRAAAEGVRMDLDSPEGWATLRRLDPVGGPEDLKAAPDLLRRVRGEAAAGRWDSARESAEILRRTIPQSPLARLLVADLAARQGDWSVAIGEYRGFIEREPRHREARLNLAAALAASGRREEARRHLESLRADFPEDRVVAERLAAFGETP